MRVGQARKRDANEREIVGALRAIGVTVFLISGEGVPDLLTFHRGQWLPVEVKRPRPRRTLSDPYGASLTPAQCLTHQQTHFPIVATIDEALALFGAVEE